GGGAPAERSAEAVAVAAAQRAPLAAVAVDGALPHAADLVVAILWIDALVVEQIDMAVLALGAADDAESERVTDAQVIGRTQLIPAAAAGGGLDVAAVVSARLLRDQAQRPADRVAAEQGPLRAAQDLDALEIEDIENRTVSRGVVDIIDIEPDPRLEGGQEVDLPEA